jgi:hypothetical protein
MNCYLVLVRISAFVRMPREINTGTLLRGVEVLRHIAIFRVGRRFHWHSTLHPCSDSLQLTSRQPSRWLKLHSEEKVVAT